MHVLFYGVTKDKIKFSAARTAAMAGQPLFLKEDLSDILKTSKVFPWSTFSISLTSQYLRLKLHKWNVC